MATEQAAQRKALYAEPYLFGGLVLLEALRFFYLIISGRVVLHDSFFRFSLQQYFYNSYFTAGETPHWVPYLTHGTTAYWWHMVQGVTGWLYYAVTVTGNLFKDVPYTVLFHGGMFIDRLLLLVGAWLYANYMWRCAYTAFAVTVMLLGSSVWETQVFFNFHYFYALPLILYLGHRFLDSGRWIFAAAAVNLYVLQALGNAAYFIPVTSLCLTVYFAVVVAGQDVRALLIRLRPAGWRRAAAAGGVMLGSAALLWYLAYLGRHDELVQFQPRRSADATLPMEVLKYYAKDVRPGQWLELLLGLSVFRDYTFYIGGLGLVGLIAAFTRVRCKALRPVAAVLATLLLMTYCLPFLQALREYWPLMKFYRHVHLIIALIRFWLCLTAGFGIHCLLGWVGRDAVAGRRTLLIAAACFTAAGCGILYVISDFDALVAVNQWLGVKNITAAGLAAQTVKLAKIKAAFSGAVVRNWVLAAALAAIVLWLRRHPGRGRTAVLLLLGILAADLGIYHVREMTRRTARLEGDAAGVLAWAPLRFHPRRSMNEDPSSGRYVFFNDTVKKRSAHYWTIDAFLQLDRPGTRLRTDHWLRGFHEYLQALNGVPVGDPQRPVWLRDKDNSLRFPEDRPAAAQISALTDDKFQFFKTAYRTDKETLSAVLGDPTFAGNLLFLFTDTGKGGPPPAAPWHNQRALHASDQVGVDFNVDRFTGNTVAVTVRNPLPDPVWMFYSDTWHPGWQGRIDGQPVPVYRAQLGYKAVAVPPGEHRVALRFFSPAAEAVLRAVGVNCLLWILWLGAAVCALALYLPAPGADETGAARA